MIKKYTNQHQQKKSSYYNIISFLEKSTTPQIKSR